MNINISNVKIYVIIASVIIGFFISMAILTIYITNNYGDEETTTTKELAEVNTEESTDSITESNADQAEKTYESPNIVNALEGDPYEELNSLVGLGSVKKEINSLANVVRIQKERNKKGLSNTPITYHYVFTGSPGTGKTTVARIVAKIYKDLGILSKGHLVETDRSGLVAEYVGQTAAKTNAVIDSALGGVLFIDEAYALSAGKEDYGPEAIATLLKRMEDDRDNLVVIVAGYTNEMEEFINTNPGLKSRFTRYINFPDYSADDLYEIYLTRAKKYEFVLTSDAQALLKEKLKYAVAHKNKNFGNARYVRNIFEQSIVSQANRLSKTKNKKHTTAELTEITQEDIAEAFAFVRN